MPLMISSMKVAAAIRSKPVTIFLFRVTPRGCRRRSNLEDRIHPTLSARVPSTFQGVCIPGHLPFKETPNGLSGLAARASASAASRCQRSAASRIISELVGPNEIAMRLHKSARARISSGDIPVVLERDRESASLPLRQRIYPSIEFRGCAQRPPGERQPTPSLR
jgi:hypothetical protein